MNFRVLYKTKVEYADLSARVYQGCSNFCKYCYCRIFCFEKGIYKDFKQTNVKSKFSGRAELVKAIKHDIKQLSNNHSLYLYFNTDPFNTLDEEKEFTNVVIEEVLKSTNWRIYTLTKRPKVGFNKIKKVVHEFEKNELEKSREGILRFINVDITQGKNNICDRLWFGITITCVNDEVHSTSLGDLEMYSDRNSERVKYIAKVKELGVKTWVSMEPIIPFIVHEDGKVEYVVKNPIEIIQEFEKQNILPDLVIIGRLNHIKQFYEHGLGIRYNPKIGEMYNKWYIENVPKLLKYLREKKINFILKKELEKTLKQYS